MLKTILVMLIALSFLPTTNAQTSSNLDLKYGINKFKLESHYSNYKANLKLSASISQNIKVYEYMGNDIKILFGQEISEINLFFYKDKLNSIHFLFGIHDNIDFDMIYSSLEKLFGYAPKQSNEEMDWFYVWSTDKTYLEFSTLPKEYGLDFVELKMRSKVIELQKLNDDF